MVELFAVCKSILIFIPQVSRKIIRKYVSADGVERQEVITQGSQEEPISIEEGQGYSKVVKRTVLKSDGGQTEVSWLENK